MALLFNYGGIWHNDIKINLRKKKMQIIEKKKSRYVLTDENEKPVIIPKEYEEKLIREGYNVDFILEKDLVKYKD
jgi:hypothetical protein